MLVFFTTKVASKVQSLPFKTVACTINFVTIIN
jgi:hypothetical protein